MLIDDFFKDINKALDKSVQRDSLTQLAESVFVEKLNELFDNQIVSNSFKMTTMTILFEGFYKSLTPSSIKDNLCKVRVNRWNNHYGTPTINFLLTYMKQIENTTEYFKAVRFKNQGSNEPWIAPCEKQSIYDTQNNVIVDSSATSGVLMPVKETTGKFIKTHNSSGGFTTTPCDPVSKKFIEYAGIVASRNGTVLEIGAAFGAASLEAIANGANVFCNDIDPNNLAVVKNRYEMIDVCNNESFSGDKAKLILVPGEFPDELSGLPKNYFDAILICRVLHFFDGAKIEKSLEQLAENLKSGGKLFIVCETPYLKNWQKFIPEFETRVREGKEWPGEITNPAEFEDSGRAASLPKFVHWITKEVLQKSLTKAKLGVEHLDYIDRCGQFPEDLLLDGRESIGAVSFKPY